MEDVESIEGGGPSGQWLKMLRSGQAMLADERPIPIIHCADQAEASMREVAVAVGIDLDDAAAARAMLLGIHYFASALLEQFPDRAGRIAMMFNILLMGIWPHLEAETILGGN